ncbi:hypothetical protein G6011_00657 [Alternaria panax]|uniref:Nuclear GTPase SLIP-GC n=1 Tax=Alternaria panax TaxID=48097 RepID=A0AAD4III8_9PLEO|nr:hypothetical protein G6011_00657 [Alternaria panax]
MDWAELQRRAKHVVPKQELKARRCWIGVLDHHKSTNESFEEADFIWMIGHSKIPMQKIQETYEKRHELTGVRISFKGRMVDQSELVKSFLLPGDDLVVFIAVDPSNITAQHQTHELPSFQEQLMQVGVARQDTAASGHVTQTANSHAGLRTMGRDLLPETAATPSRLSQRASGRSVTYSVPNLAPPLTPRHASTLSSISPAIEPVRHPSWHQTRYPDPEPVQDELSLPLQRPNSALNPPRFSANAFCDTSFQETAAPGMHNRTRTTELERLREPSEEMNDNAQGTLEHSHVKEERQPPALFQDTPVFQNDDVEPESSFDPSKIFKKEAIVELSIREELGSVDRSIRSVIELQDPDLLETGVSTSLKILRCLKEKFSQYLTSNADDASWVQAIEKLLPQSERKRTVVGVVGNTGAGKSSVINAMLDEERLVPTNCMRACTAVVTEISWNSSIDPSSKYRAEIEFISQVDWEKELTVLLGEFLSENGKLSRDAQDQNSDAGIAWAKFHAVYPSVPRDALGECDVPSLMSRRSVIDVLGTTKEIHAARPQYFYQELQRYVDSKEKVSKKGKNKEKASKPAVQVEYWPLIKVVKIYTKSHALSTGAVIVDLPGVHDSNAARAAVAQGYMKQCTGLWIVAPINRAVDDKAAKTLLGDSFKRQLKYDGGFSSVTFVCSKTDDISITEAIDSLGLEDKVAEFEEQQDQCNDQIQQIQSKIKDLNESREVYKIAISSASEDIELWETLQEQLDEGKPAFAPLPKTRKRKNIGSSKQSRKRKQAFDDDTDDDFEDSDDDESESDNEVIFQAERTHLSEAHIKEKLRELRETKKNARREGIEIKHSVDELKPQIRELEARKDEIKANISRICIAGRNQYSKYAIQQDFAAGIKEIDQENAAEEDEDNFNPDEELRDYDQVARSLPVFCVSSRAYQKMCGRMQKDDEVPGFVTPEETEVPQLQAHCRKLTEGGRIQTSRAFMTSVCQMLNTFSLWASNDGIGLKMSSEEKQKQIVYLQRRLSELTEGLEAAIRACIREMRSELKSQIFDKCPELINEAIQTAPTTAHAWGYKDQGGLAWASYKAVVRRDGVYHSAAAGHRDFNADLVDPIKVKLAAGWERAFQMRLPKAVDAYVKNSSTLLHGFHEAIEERTKTSGVSLANLSILETQISNFEQLFKDLGGTLLTQMTELQREANREFTPCIANIMHTAYDVCTDEHGPGSYKRMKEHMANHVDQERHRMFHEAIKTVVKHLDDMCKALQESMEAKADEIYALMNRDYTHVLGGVTGNQPVYLQSKEERKLRSEVREILKGVDAQFESIVSGEIAPEEAAKTSGAGSQGEEYINVDVEESRGNFDSAHDSFEDGVDGANSTHTQQSIEERKGDTSAEHDDLRFTVEDDMEEI